MAEPLFSIMIPTRNRASLLGDALASVLEQDFEDYEVTVVDNASSDSTSEVARSTGDRRVRQVRHDRVLSMPDNWEAAWREARGRYVLYLCDDDMLAPGHLRYLAERVLPLGVPLVSWSGAMLYHRESPEKEHAGSLRVPVGGQELMVVECASLASDLHAFKDRAWYPHLMNCCAERARFEEIRAKHGRLFFPPAPDYSFMSLAAQELDSMLASERPRYVIGRTASSVGSSFESRSSSGEVQREFLAEFEETDPLAGCPCRAPVVPNYIASTLLGVAEARKAQALPAKALDYSAYVYALSYYMGRQRSLIAGFDEHARSLLQVAAAQSGECAAAARAMLSPAPKTNSLRDRLAGLLFRDGLPRRWSWGGSGAPLRSSRLATQPKGKLLRDEWLGDSVLIPLERLGTEKPQEIAKLLPGLARSLEESFARFGREA